jgi:hypothetical protein
LNSSAVVLMVLGFASLAPRPALLFKETLALTALQAVLLLLPGLGAGRLPALALALALAVVAAFRGGPLAALAVLSFFVGGALFLGVDHFERRLALHASAKPRLAGAAVRETVRAAALPAALLLAWLVLAPPRPHAGLNAATLDALLDREKLAPAYLQLVFVSMLGATLVHYVSGWLRGSGRGERAALEMTIPERGPEEVLRRDARGSLDRAGARGSVVRAYVTFLAEAAGRVLVRRPDHTAREVAAVVKAPGADLARLTELFDAARYGPHDPDAEAIRHAQASSAVLVEWLRSRDKTRPTPR